MLAAHCVRLPKLVLHYRQLPSYGFGGRVRCASSAQEQPDILRDKGIKTSVQQATAKANARALRIETKGRHIFLCVATKELGIDKQGPVFRSKVDCLRICAMGPVALVQPDQVYYHSCTPEVLELIIQEHLVNGRIVEKYRVRED